jgi:hypothetical protein
MMSNERRLATFAFSLLLLAYAIALFAPSHSMAQPVNFGKSRLMVTAFGADNTGERWPQFVGEQNGSLMCDLSSYAA